MAAGFATLMTWLGTPGCVSDSIDVRAIWVETTGDARLRRIHVYEGGRDRVLKVAGETKGQEFVRLGPRGRGLYLRLGADANDESIGAWLSLLDGRRLVMRQPRLEVSDYPVTFTERGDALLWLRTSTLELVPLAPGLALERDALGVAESLRFEGIHDWVLSASQAPILLASRDQGGASFLRYPEAGTEHLELVELARIEDVDLPQGVNVVDTCSAIAACGRSLALAPRGERAILRSNSGLVEVLDARPRGVSGPMSLPPELEGSQLSLLQVLGPSASVWATLGQLHLWDERRALVESVPIFVGPPLHSTPAAAGEALSLVSSQGPLIRVDSAGIELLSLETSSCTVVGQFAPVVSPEGSWAAWSCVDEQVMDEDGDLTQTGGAGSIVRVSAAGLERYVGVPMRVLAIDDEGGLLIHSVESLASDEVDDISPRTRPRTLFVLSREGVLERVSELEPAPEVTLIDFDVQTYIQAVAY